MKTGSIIIGSIVLLLNIVLGVMLSSYNTFNCLLNSGIIITTIALLLGVSVLQLKDGFKISFYCLFPFICSIELILGFLSPESLTDNHYIITIIVITFIQLSILVLSKIVSLIN